MYYGAVEKSTGQDGLALTKSENARLALGLMVLLTHQCTLSNGDGATFFRKPMHNPVTHFRLLHVVNSITDWFDSTMRACAVWLPAAKTDHQLPTLPHYTSPLGQPAFLNAAFHAILLDLGCLYCFY